MNKIQKPAIQTSTELNVENIEKKTLSNGLPYYPINAGEQDVVKIDFIFDAGIISGKNPAIADFTNELLSAGTKNRTAKQIAEKLDFYGAFLELDVLQQFSSITLYTLNKHFNKTFEIITDLIFNPIFPEKEIEILKAKKLQSFEISRQKTSIVSKELFAETLFGKSHPYGRNTTYKDINNINKSDIEKFYKENYNLESLKIIISGNILKEHIQQLENTFGKAKLPLTKHKKNNFNKEELNSKKIFKEIEGTLQSSLKIGKETINRLHPDYFNLSITSIILGGYFGSRLMTNIREDKGYTYGINSSNMSLANAGIFVISASSGKDVYKKAIVEIYKELKLLRTELVLPEELDRVRNYLTGSFAKMFDGVFAKSNILKALLNYNLNLDYYQNYFKALQEITPKIIKDTANKYLQENEMIEVVVGAK